MYTIKESILPRRIQVASLHTLDTDLKRFPSLHKTPSTAKHLPSLKSSSPSPCLKPTLSLKRTVSPKPRFSIQDQDFLKDSKLPSLVLSSKASQNVVSRLAFKTRAGQMNGKPKLTNQDSLTIRPNFRGTKGSYLFTVQDGHGTYGFQVSQFIRSTFPVLLEKHLDFNFSSFSIERNITKVIHKLTESLQNSGIEIAFSGSTLNSVLIFGNSLICSNIGDSRAILGRFSEEGWGFLSLSSDHSLKRFDERQRILNSNGRIDYSLNSEGKPVGPERVWLADENIPGLAMTRSIGDSISKVVGVTSDPETIVRRLRPEDKFLVMASDGLWEKLSNEDVLSIVSSYFAGKNVEEATAHLVNEATRRWRLDDYRDDITVIVVFLQVF